MGIVKFLIPAKHFYFETGKTRGKRHSGYGELCVPDDTAQFFFAEFSVLLSGRCDRCAGRERRTEKWPADFYQEKQGEGTSLPARGRGTPVPAPVMEKRRKSLTKSLLLHIL